VKTLPRIPIVLGVLAFALAMALPEARSFSDTIYLVGRVESGAPPYYNVAYVPLGQLFKAVFGGWLGTEGALLLLSAAAIGGGVAFASDLARRLGAGALGTTLVGLLLAFAPGVLFFGGVIEVHAVQFLGASAALWLAWRARAAPPRNAWLGLGLAMLLAMLAHLSNLLLLPGLIALAWRPAKDAATGCRLSRRGLPALGILTVAGATAAVILWQSDFAIWSVHPALQWLGTLLVFGDTFLSGFAERGFFTLPEAASYLGAELILPFGLLVFGFLDGALLALRKAPNETSSFARRALFACLPALLVLPQGGVLERGGYFMSYAPLLAILFGVGAAKLGGAERRALFFASVLIGVQLVLAVSSRQAFRATAPEARIWASAAAAEVQPGDSVLVAGLSRTFALAAAAPGCRVRDLARDLAMVPDRARKDTLERVLTERLSAEAFPGDLWLDADLLPGLTADGLTGQQASLDFPAAWQTHLLHLLTEVSPVPTSFEPLDLGASEQPGLAGFDPTSAPALIRVRRR